MIFCRPFLFALFVLVGSSLVQAQEPIRWEWSVGETARYAMTQTMHMDMNAGPQGRVESNSTQQMLMRWTVDAIDAEGVATISQGFDRVRMQTEGPMGNNFEYDSASDAAPVGMATMVAPLFDALVGSSIVAKMLPTGEYTDVQLSEELAEALKRLPGGAMSADMVTQMTKQGSIAFPEEPISPGATWTQESEVNAPQIGKMRVETTFTYNGPKELDGHAYESFTPRIAMSVPGGEGEQPMKVTFTTRDSSGEILFDPVEGRIASSLLRQVIDIQVVAGTMTIDNTMTQTIEMRSLAEGEEPDFEMAEAEPAGATAE